MLELTFIAINQRFGGSRPQPHTIHIPSVHKYLVIYGFKLLLMELELGLGTSQAAADRSIALN